MAKRAALLGTGILVSKSDEHWTLHSVPGIRSQQTTVQSPSVVENAVRWFKAAFVACTTVTVIPLRRFKAASALGVTVAIAFDREVEVDVVVVAVEVELNVAVAMAVEVGVDVEKPSEQ